MDVIFILATIFNQMVNYTQKKTEALVDAPVFSIIRADFKNAT